MSQEAVTIDLFNRWEQVWHEGKFDLVPSCVAETYIRHDHGSRITRQPLHRLVFKPDVCAESTNTTKDT
jgi:hypothetical protein